MSKRELIKELETLDKKKLVALISDLYDKDKSVKEYLDYIVNPDEKEALKTYKERVREAFYPKRGFGFKLAAGKKAISDFRKLKPSANSIIDLMMLYVECGVEFTNDFGDINEHFYSSLEKVYRDALNLVYKNGLYDKYKPRAKEIMNDTVNIGYGFHDALADLYYEVFD